MLADEEETDTEPCDNAASSNLGTKSTSITNGFIPKQPSSTNHASMYQPQRSNQHSDNSFMIQLPKVVEDGRTTVMIRNIPNKYTENLLLELFNKNHKKKIDFFYLPIDYKVLLVVSLEQLQRGLRLHELHSSQIHWRILPRIPQ